MATCAALAFAFAFAFAFGLSLANVEAGENKTVASGEAKTILLEAESWEFTPGSVTFEEHRGRKSMRIQRSNGPVVLRKFSFTNGIIQYDIMPNDPRFASVYFRWNGQDENECFYFRTRKAGNPKANDAIQYAPHIDGVNLWDMLFHFQASVNFKKDDWNTVKLVISGKQMRVYVNDLTKPALEVPYLEGNRKSGSIAFDGQAVISELTVVSGATEGLAAEPGTDPTAEDARYLRKWQVSDPIAMEKGIDFQDKSDGRCALENAALKVPLVKGENQLLVGVANSFYGWGLVARFEDTEGLTIAE